MTAAYYIGIDPGPTPGIVRLTPPVRPGQQLEVDVIQCTAQTACTVLWSLLSTQIRKPEHTVLVQIERFVVGRRAGRSSSAGAGEVTRDLIGRLQREAEHHEGVSVVLRSASTAKAWATDERLERAGLLGLTKGMRHARDAARHALFAATHAGAFPDPLSSRGDRR